MVTGTIPLQLEEKDHKLCKPGECVRCDGKEALRLEKALAEMEQRPQPSFCLPCLR